MRPHPFIRRLLADRRGASAVEYGLILSFIVMAIFGALVTLSGKTRGMWDYVSNQVINAH